VRKTAVISVNARELGCWSSKAKNVLGFEVATTLDEMLDEVIAWIDEAIKNGTI
jgi:nucleoside-diphosphate-sugar epimerase